MTDAQKLERYETNARSALNTLGLTDETVAGLPNPVLSLSIIAVDTNARRTELEKTVRELLALSKSVVEDELLLWSAGVEEAVGKKFDEARERLAVRERARALVPVEDVQFGTSDPDLPGPSRTVLEALKTTIDLASADHGLRNGKTALFWALHAVLQRHLRDDKSETSP